MPIVLTLIPFVDYEELGEIGWNLLIAVMLVRPLSNVFPDIRLLASLLVIRREVGILSGLFIVGHGVGYFSAKGMSIVTNIFAPEFWGLSNFLTWGILGLFCAIILLATSNKFSVKLLKRNWKRVQQLAYLFFLFGGIHIALIGDELVSGIVPVIVVMVFYVLASLKVKFRLM